LAQKLIHHNFAILAHYYNIIFLLSFHLPASTIHFLIMALYGFSWLYVKIWAEETFGDGFEHTPLGSTYTIENHRVTKNKSTTIKALLVGSAIEEVYSFTRAPTDIWVWLDGGRMRAGYIVSPNSCTREMRPEDITDENVRFIEPFSWVMGDREKVTIARLEAFVRCVFLLRGATTACKLKSALIKTHLPGACKAVTNSTVVTSEDPIDMCTQDEDIEMVNGGTSTRRFRTVLVSFFVLIHI
jgi:hypothetical protein